MKNILIAGFLAMFTISLSAQKASKRILIECFSGKLTELNGCKNCVDSKGKIKVAYGEGVKISYDYERFKYKSHVYLIGDITFINDAGLVTIYGRDFSGNKHEYQFTLALSSYTEQELCDVIDGCSSSGGGGSATDTDTRLVYDGVNANGDVVFNVFDIVTGTDTGNDVIIPACALGSGNPINSVVWNATQDTVKIALVDGMTFVFEAIHPDNIPVDQDSLFSMNMDTTGFTDAVLNLIPAFQDQDSLFSTNFDTTGFFDAVLSIMPIDVDSAGNVYALNGYGGDNTSQSYMDSLKSKLDAALLAGGSDGAVTGVVFNPLTKQLEFTGSGIAFNSPINLPFLLEADSLTKYVTPQQLSDSLGTVKDSVRLARNGLSILDNYVELGGQLYKTTAIDLNSNALNFTDGTSFYSFGRDDVQFLNNGANGTQYMTLDAGGAGLVSSTQAYIDGQNGANGFAAGPFGARIKIDAADELSLTGSKIDATLDGTFMRLGTHAGGVTDIEFVSLDSLDSWYKDSTSHRDIVGGIELTQHRTDQTGATTVIRTDTIPTSESPFAWYEGGDQMRVWATYDPFATGNYTKNSAGDYDFVTPSGEQLDKVEFVVNTSLNLNSTNNISIKVSTPTGNTTTLNTSNAEVTINSNGSGVLHAGEQLLGGTTAAVSGTGGTLTVSMSQMSSHNTRKVSITNIIQNAQ